MSEYFKFVDSGFCCITGDATALSNARAKSNGGEAVANSIAEAEAEDGSSAVADSSAEAIAEKGGRAFADSVSEAIGAEGGYAEAVSEVGIPSLCCKLSPTMNLFFMTCSKHLVHDPAPRSW